MTFPIAMGLMPSSQATWSSPRSRRTTAALVYSPLISAAVQIPIAQRFLRYVRRCTSGLWPITAATSA